MSSSLKIAHPQFAGKMIGLVVVGIFAIAAINSGGANRGAYRQTTAERDAFEAELAKRRPLAKLAWEKERDAIDRERERRRSIAREVVANRHRKRDAVVFDAREKEAWDAYHANRINLAEREGLLARIADEKKAKEEEYKNWPVIMRWPPPPGKTAEQVQAEAEQ